MTSTQPSPLATSSAAADTLHPREAERPVSMMSFQSNGTAGLDGDGGRPERGRKKRLKGPHETLIFVRPPPTSKTPAMNVQVQLVAPGAGRSRAASDTSYHSTTSFAPSAGGDDGLEEPRDAPPETAEPEQMECLSPPSTGTKESFGGNGRPLSRSSSIKSTNSLASNGTGASSSKKRIVPLYNLNFHTVLTTVITDAGTDAKVAKFLKRSVEITGVGVLEPYEQWPPLSSSAHFSVESSPSSLRNNTPLPSDPTSPRMSLDTVFNRKNFQSQEDANGSEPKKLFGRFWGTGTKKEKPTTTGGTTSDFSFFRSAGGAGGLFGLKQSPSTPPLAAVPSTVPEGTHISTSNFPLSRESTNTDSPRPQPFIGTPCLGTYPIVRPALEKVAGARPSAYVWTVNKWASPNDAWSFASLADSLSPSAPPSTSSAARPTPYAPSVRFEWIRGLIRPSRSAPSSNPDVPRRTSASGEPRSASRPRQLAVGEAQNGSRPNSPRGSKTSLALSGRAESPRPSQDGEEEEDPEDSEVPWHCWVKNSSGTNCFLGTLSPAPHHPKVLAQLKTPYPMSPFALIGLKDKDSISSDALKDVVVTTAMWLFIREEWGGIGKKGRRA